MATTPTTPTGLPPPKRYQVPTIPAFEKWAEGRTGFSKGELAEIYASSFGLAPEALKKLEGEIGAKATTTLIPKPVAKPKVPPQVTTRPAPDLLIARTPYPKWWKDSLNAKINLTAPGSAVLATVSGNLRLFVATIVLTVTGETVIRFTFGNAGSSGPIYLGGENQPMGMVVAMGNSPAPCGAGKLTISATDPGDGTPSVGGWATCFAEESK